MSQPFIPGSTPTSISQLSSFQQYGPSPTSAQQLTNHMARMTIGSVPTSAAPPAGLGYGEFPWHGWLCMHVTAFGLAEPF